MEMLLNAELFRLERFAFNMDLEINCVFTIHSGYHYGPESYYGHMVFKRVFGPKDLGTL